MRVGKTVPKVAADEQIVEWDEHACSPDEPELSGWNPVYDDWPFGIFARGGSSVATEQSKITIIEVLSAEIRTAHGLGVGSSITDLKKLGAKPGKSFNDESGYVADAWLIHGNNGELVFWVWHGTVPHPRFTLGEVMFTLVQEKNAEPYFPYELDNCS